jgi:rubrerythrin
VESSHERRYLKFLEWVEKGTVFRRDAPIKWKCRNCGYVHEAAEVPLKCPVCAHARAYFEPWAENY